MGGKQMRGWQVTVSFARRLTAATAGAMAAGLAVPAVAAAHAGGTVEYRFPVPIWLYALGGATAVLASVPVAMWASDRGTQFPDDSRPRRNLYPWIRPLHAGPILTAVAAVVLLDVLFGGFRGVEEFAANPATIVFWVDLWVGVGITSALLANLWDFVSPLTAAGRLLDRVLGERGLALEQYPARLGVWPSAGLLLGLAWLELCWPHGSEPLVLATLISLYWVAQLAAMAVFGAETWLARGELFTVFARTLGRFAPLETYVDGAEGACAAARCRDDDHGRIGCPACFRDAPADRRGVRWRGYGAGIRREPPLEAGGSAFVVALLATVVFDGFSRTSTYITFVNWLSDRAGLLARHSTLLRTVVMLGVVAAFSLLFLAVCALLARFETGGTLAAARRYAPTLIPIAGVYFVAHYLTYLIIYSQFTWKVLLDPLETDWVPDIGVWSHLPSGPVWWTQVGVIVAGHVVAVFEAHRIARAAQPRAAQRRSVAVHSPLTMLMIAYTAVGLWVLGQSISG
jgi:hypothetical protein